MNKLRNPDDMRQFELGLEILARLQPEMAVLPERGLLEPLEIQVYPTPRSPTLSFRLPTREEILQETGPLPPDSILLGLSDDHLPILFDLRSGMSGSLLVIGDPAAGKTSFLLAALENAIASGSSRRLRFAWLSQHLEELGDLQCDPHCFRAASFSDSSAREAIQKYAQIAEQRRYGRQMGPALLLVVDSLVEAARRLDAETYDLLLWLIEKGPASQVFTLASLDARRLNQIDPQVVDLFGAWIVGSIDPAQTGPRLVRLPFECAGSLIPGQQFCVFFLDEWIPFWRVEGSSLFIK